MVQADAGWMNAAMESFRYLALNRLCVLYPTLCTGIRHHYEILDAILPGDLSAESDFGKQRFIATS